MRYLIDQVPERFQPSLHSLENLSDDALRGVMEQQLSHAKQLRYQELLGKNEQQLLTSSSEQEELLALREEADLLMFQRSYAAVLLKMRDHPKD